MPKEQDTDPCFVASGGSPSWVDGLKGRRSCKPGLKATVSYAQAGIPNSWVLLEACLKLPQRPPKPAPKPFSCWGKTNTMQSQFAKESPPRQNLRDTDAKSEASLRNEVWSKQMLTATFRHGCFTNQGNIRRCSKETCSIWNSQEMPTNPGVVRKRSYLRTCYGSLKGSSPVKSWRKRCLMFTWHMAIQGDSPQFQNERKHKSYGHVAKLQSNYPQLERKGPSLSALPTHSSLPVSHLSCSTFQASLRANRRDTT